MATLFQKRNNKLVQVAPSTDVTKKFNDAKDKLDQIEAAGGYTLPPATTTTLGGVKVDNQTTFTDSDGTLYTRLTPVAPSDDVPAELQDSPHPGVSSDFSRADHVHPAQDMTMDAGGGAKNVVIDADLKLTAEHERKLLVMANKPGLKIFLPEPGANGIEADGVSYVIRVTGDYDVTVVNHKGGAVGDGNGVCAVGKTRIFILLDVKGTWMSSEWEGYIPVKQEGIAGIELGIPAVFAADVKGAVVGDSTKAAMILSPHSATSANKDLNQCALYYINYNPDTNSITTSARSGSYFSSTSEHHRGESYLLPLNCIKGGCRQFLYVQQYKQTTTANDSTYKNCFDVMVRLVAYYDTERGTNTSAYSKWCQLTYQSHINIGGCYASMMNAFDGTSLYPAKKASTKYPVWAVAVSDTRVALFGWTFIKGTGLSDVGSSCRMWVTYVDITYGDPALNQDETAGATLKASSYVLYTNNSYFRTFLYIEKFSDTHYLVALDRWRNSSNTYPSNSCIELFLIDVTYAGKKVSNTISLPTNITRLSFLGKLGDTMYCTTYGKSVTVTSNTERAFYKLTYDGTTLAATRVELNTFIPGTTYSSANVFVRSPAYDSDDRYGFTATQTETTGGLQRQYVYLFDTKKDTLVIPGGYAYTTQTRSGACDAKTSNRGGWTLPYDDTGSISIQCRNGSGTYANIGDAEFYGYFVTSPDMESHAGSDLRQCFPNLRPTPLGAATGSYVSGYTQRSAWYLQLSKTTFLLFGMSLISSVSRSYIIPCKILEH